MTTFGSEEYSQPSTSSILESSSTTSFSMSTLEFTASAVTDVSVIASLESPSSDSGSDKGGALMEPVALQPQDSFCSNSHIVSPDTIIKFTENMDMLMFVMSILSSLLQAYVMVQAVKHIRRRTSDKCMHVFLLSMTTADFLLTALCYPIELAPRAGLIKAYPKAVLATMHMLSWVGLIVSSISLVLLNVDKLFFFRFPLSYAKFFNRAKAIGLSAACWAGASAFVLFAWFTHSFHCVDEDCITLAIFPNRLYIYLPFMISVGVIPTITSLIVAVYIMRIVESHRRQMKAQESIFLFATKTEVEDEQQTILFHQNNDNNENGGIGEANGKTTLHNMLSMDTTNNNYNYSEAEGDYQQRRASRASLSRPRSNSFFSTKMRTFYFIFMTTVFTALTLLPYRIAGLYRTLNTQNKSDCVTIFLYWIMMYMIYLNSIVNPLLTVTVLPRYRINFCNTCGTFWAKLYHVFAALHSGKGRRNVGSSSEIGQNKKHPLLLAFPMANTKFSNNNKANVNIQNQNTRSHSLSAGETKKNILRYQTSVDGISAALSSENQQR